MEYKDINSELCIKCGACCRVFFPIQGDERYFEFLEGIGLNLIRNKKNKTLGKIDFGYCKNLNTSDNLYKCKIYEGRPKLCKDFNCLAWSNYTNVNTELLEHAKKVHQENSGTTN